MAELVLKAETGRVQGTRPSRRLRREGKVPAVVYGLGQDPVAVTVDFRELRAALTGDAGMNALIGLEIDGGSPQLSIVKDMQRHPVRNDVLHVDFLRLDANAPIAVDVPVVLVGEAEHVVKYGSMVDQNMFSITVLSRPDDIPNEIEVDITDLKVGEAIRIGDLTLPAGVTTELDPEDPVASGLVTRTSRELMKNEQRAEAGEDLEAEGDAESSDDADDADE